MIRERTSTHCEEGISDPMGELELSHPRNLTEASRATDARAGTDQRVRELLDAQYEFVWRVLRRLGLSSDQAEDAAQQVFLVASRRIGDVEDGKERSFLFGIARRTASDVRRSAEARRETSATDLPESADTSPDADELVDRRRAREMLDAVLDEMDEDLRAVFVLFELEDLGLSEIAEMLGIPRGTAASRLRRARERFHEIVKRLAARRRPEGATP